MVIERLFLYLVSRLQKHLHTLPEEGKCVFELQEISKSFGEKKVLNRFSLAFPPQGVVCLMGPSGCGKTTLLRLIAGLQCLDAGEVAGIAGKKISFAFQEDRLLPWFTVLQNLLAGAARGAGHRTVRPGDAGQIGPRGGGGPLPG
jgi:ABC-type nitrate/sulfonate/bicarbonate transport system ATPase subunit